MWKLLESCGVNRLSGHCLNSFYDGLYFMIIPQTKTTLLEETEELNSLL